MSGVVEGAAKSTAKILTEGPIKQSINEVFNTVNKGVESLDLLGKYGRKQKKHIKTTHVNIKLLGMTSPIPLASIFYPTHVSTTIRRRLYEQEWLSEIAPSPSTFTKATHNKKAISVDATKYVEENPKVVVLCGPGAGKTTFLRFLALMHADAIVDTPKHLELLPFFVHLPHFAKTNQGLFEFAIETLIKATDKYAADFASRVFGAGKALLLLDSYDEIPRAQRSDVIIRIKLFESLYPNVRIMKRSSSLCSSVTSVSALCPAPMIMT